MFFLIRARCWVIASHYQLRQTVYPIPLSRPILSHIIVVISFSCVFQFRPCLVRPGCAARPVDSSYLRCLPRCSLTPSLWFYLFWCCCFFSVLCAVLFSLFCRVVKRVSLRWPAAGTAAARRSSGAPSSFQFQSDPAVRLYGILWVPIWRSISVPPTRKPYQFIVVFFSIFLLFQNGECLCVYFSFTRFYCIEWPCGVDAKYPVASVVDIRGPLRQSVRDSSSGRRSSWTEWEKKGKVSAGKV